jgi:hypothetical protein
MDQLGIELELGLLLVLQIVGSTIFAVFEIETEKWRLIFKWLIVASITVGLFFWIGHWSLIAPILMSGLGTILHFKWCNENNIHPLHATPRRKYYELRKWEWKD